LPLPNKRYYKTFKLENFTNQTSIGNKNFYDYMLITERLFDLTDKEPKSIQFKETLLRKIGDENILKALARSLYFDRYLNLFEKYIKWSIFSYG